LRPPENVRQPSNDYRAEKTSAKRIRPGTGWLTVTSPPCNCMIAATMARPRPLESELWWREASPR
nr:hypothetical protein [Tanacetum cinerariifolium]